MFRLLTVFSTTLVFTSVNCWFRPLDYFACLAGYCCIPTYIPGNIEGLEKGLKENLYGQHLALNTVVHALRNHWDLAGTNQKALTLSFHGPPGTGKSYVSQFIRKYLFTNMKFVHHFDGRIHFPDEKSVFAYKVELSEWIRGNVTQCGRQLFIFDNSDKMPTGVLNAIKPFLDYNLITGKNDYSDCIFIFLSNAGSQAIVERVFQLRNQGIKRDDLKLAHFEKLIWQGAFNEKGGFHLSDNIRSNLIDHYIPFLLLEQEQVRMCILDEFRKRSVRNVEEKHIQEIMDVLDWGPESHKLFSKSGCKRISEKAELYVNMYYPHATRREL